MSSSLKPAKAYSGTTGACMRADVDRAAVLREPFWEQFELLNSSGQEGLPAGLADAAAANKDFTLHDVCLRGGQGGACSGASAGTERGAPGHALTMGFKCASRAACTPLMCLSAHTMSPITHVGDPRIPDDDCRTPPLLRRK